MSENIANFGKLSENFVSGRISGHMSENPTGQLLGHTSGKNVRRFMNKETFQDMFKVIRVSRYIMIF